MSVASISSNLSSRSIGSSLEIKSTKSAPSGVSFQKTLDAIGSGDALQMPKSIAVLEKKVLRGAPVNPSELLSAQINIHKFNLKVELVSKAVEGIVSTVKRVQQQN